MEYYRESYFERQKREVFPKVWLSTGWRSQDIEEPGDFHYRAEVAANWKVMLDAFQEAYHVPFLHRRSQPDAVEKANPLSLALDIVLQGPHGQLSFPANQSSIVYGRDPTTAVPESMPPATRRLVDWSKESVHEEFSREHFPPGVNPTRQDNWSFDINVIYPNWWLAVRGDHVHTYNFWPISHDRTVWDVRLYYPKPENVKERLAQEMRRVRLRNTLPEDLSTVEGTQAVLNSGARDHFVLTDEEILIAHHHHIGDRMLSGDYI